MLIDTLFGMSAGGAAVAEGGVATAVVVEGDPADDMASGLGLALFNVDGRRRVRG